MKKVYLNCLGKSPQNMVKRGQRLAGGGKARLGGRATKKFSLDTHTPSLARNLAATGMDSSYLRKIGYSGYKHA
jgi:hypothetical protein